MANIKQCDICKAVYPGLSWKDKFGLTAVPETDTVRLDSVSLMPDNSIHYDKVTYDICPDCHSKILGFIEGLSKEESNITEKDFNYEVVPEPLILEPEDYPGEQWDLLCKVFGTPGASSIRVENYDISAFYEEVSETCRRRLMREYPEEINSDYYGGCGACPHTYGYADRPDYCLVGQDNYTDMQMDETCRKCWGRPVEEVKIDEKV